MYKIQSKIGKLPPHQRRKLAGRPVRTFLAGRNLLKGPAYLSEEEIRFNLALLKDMRAAGEIEVYGPDGSVFSLDSVGMKPEVKPVPLPVFKPEVPPEPKPIPISKHEDLPEPKPLEIEPELELITTDDSPKEDRPKKRGRPPK